MPWSLFVSAALTITASVARVATFRGLQFSDRVVSFGSDATLSAALLLAAAFVGVGVAVRSSDDPAAARSARVLRNAIASVSPLVATASLYSSFVTLTTWSFGRSRLTEGLDVVGFGVRASDSSFALAGALMAVVAVVVARAADAHESTVELRDVDAWPVVSPAVAIALAAACVAIGRAIQDQIVRPSPTPSQTTQILDRLTSIGSAVATPTVGAIALVAIVVLALVARPTPRSVGAVIVVVATVIGALVGALALFGAYRVGTSHSVDVFGSGAWARLEVITTRLSAAPLGVATIVVAASIRRRAAVGWPRSAASHVPTGSDRPARLVIAACATAAIVSAVGFGYVATHAGDFSTLDFLAVDPQLLQAVLGLALGAALIAAVCGAGSRRLAGVLGAVGAVGLVTEACVIHHVLQVHHRRSSLLAGSAVQRGDFVAAAMTAALLALALLSVAWNSYPRAAVQLGDEVAVAELQWD